MGSDYYHPSDMSIFPKSITDSLTTDLGNKLFPGSLAYLLNDEKYHLPSYYSSKFDIDQKFDISYLNGKVQANMDKYTISRFRLYDYVYQTNKISLAI